MRPPDWQTDDGSIQLYRGDCLEILPEMGDGAVELIATDPPYNEVNRPTGGLRIIDKGLADSSPVCIQRVAREFARIAHGSLYVWCGTEQVSDWRSTFVEAGMTTRQGVWEKTNPSPMNGQYMWLSSVELCVFARHSGAVFNPHCKSPVWRTASPRTTAHPTEKPLCVIGEHVTASTQAGDTAFDPFMGSGTTGVACAKTGRKFIGIELEPRYFDIAVKRISAEVRQGKLFT